MAKTILTEKCPFCGKLAAEKDRITLGSEIWIELACGHTLIKDALKTDESIRIVSSDGRELFPFQIETVKFAEAADCNCLILHEMGLGKTVIECALLARNPDLLPALIVVKSGLRAQWFMEIFRWTGMAAQVITSSRELPHFDIFKVVIVSIDTLRLLRPDVKVVSDWDVAMAEASGKKISKQRPVIWTDEICAQFKHICVDESQKIKNPGSSRTQALRKIAAAANNGSKARVTCMSGTNIEKHAGEYFVTLNLTRPELFPSQSTYQIQHCEVNIETGKLGGLKNPERFRELTKDFIIRYKRDDVLPDLPKIFRQFRLAELEGGELDAYIKVVKEFMEAMEDPERPMLPTDILGFLSKMRHITGIAKVDAAVDFAEEFLLETERKLVIFLHHKMAAAILEKKLGERMKEGAFNPPLSLHSQLDLNQRMAVIEEFRKPENRIMLASTLASGEGLNLQFCSDCLIMERQWNPSYEEQAEARFPRPGSTADRVNATYLIAAGTIDDFLTDIVETKRRNVAQTLDGKEIEWDEKSLVGELAKVLQTKGLAKWRLSR
jgi:SNF2 family DNA or RNA helicase